MGTQQEWRETKVLARTVKWIGCCVLWICTAVRECSSEFSKSDASLLVWRGRQTLNYLIRLITTFNLAIHQALLLAMLHREPFSSDIQMSCGPKERQREREKKMYILITQVNKTKHKHFVTWQLQRDRVNRGRKKWGGGPRHLAGWQHRAQTHHLDGRMSESGRGRWIGADRQRKGGSGGTEPRMRERPRPDILTSHILISFGSFPYSTFHDSLDLTPQKQPGVQLLLWAQTSGRGRCWWAVIVCETVQIAQ